MTNPIPRILVIPGLGGSGPEHWQSRWEALHPGHLRVAQRDWDRPARDEWVGALDRAIAAACSSAEPPVLVAHSLGCALVAHWARRHTSARARARAALLVAPADVDAPDRTPPETRGFAPMPLDPLPFAATVVGSDDDPYVALTRARGFAAAWGAAFVDAGARGHLNAASGLGDWPEGRALLQALIARAR
jgi:predicted alpha/beta hydrolase family esterase